MDPVDANTTAASPSSGDTVETGSHASGRAWSSPAVKFFAVAFLVGLLVVPLLFVWALSSDRESRRAEVLSTIENDWGGRQILRGPFLVVPYRIVGKTDEQVAIVLPDTLDVTADAMATTRSISIYEAPVYSASVEATARFPAVAPAMFGSNVETVDWPRARVAIWVPYVRGIEAVSFEAGGRVLEVGPTVGVSRLSLPGVSANPEFRPDATGAVSGFDFHLTMQVRGSDAFAIYPAGRETTVTITSNWKHPSFPGWMLPSEREVTQAGFKALWRVPGLARATPQVLTSNGSDYAIQYAIEQDRSAGVTLGDPVDTYKLMDRALKYGVMFVASIFYIVFFLEILSPKRIHVVQYMLVGMIAVFFYVLLLALAEHVTFNIAYLVASAASGGVIAAFVAVALASPIRGAIAAAGFAGLFALLYAILRLEDVALLAGALVGFVLLTVVLFATRRVNWSGPERSGLAAPVQPAVGAVTASHPS